MLSDKVQGDLEAQQEGQDTCREKSRNGWRRPQNTSLRAVERRIDRCERSGAQRTGSDSPIGHTPRKWRQVANTGHAVSRQARADRRRYLLAMPWCTQTALGVGPCKYFCTLQPCSRRVIHARGETLKRFLSPTQKKNLCGEGIPLSQNSRFLLNFALPQHPLWGRAFLIRNSAQRVLKGS